MILQEYKVVAERYEDALEKRVKDLDQGSFHDV